MRSLLIATWVTCVLSCASLQVHSVHDPAVDFSQYEHFDFLPLTMPAPGESNPDPLNNQLIGKRLQVAIERDLTARGYSKVAKAEGASDFRVSVQLASREKLDIRTYPNTWGYGGRVAGASYVETYTEATLIIEIADAASGELVWQGWVVGPSSASAPSDARLAEVVSKVLATFPPSSSESRP